jgi:FixJ family two-component response regulator
MTVIAIIDDDAQVRAATENLVNSYGLETRGFDSAESFLAADRADEIACLITDVQMPGMTGLDLQALLVRRGTNLPIIFITAYPEERTRIQAEAMGAAGFFTKPFDANYLMECIQRVACN